MRGAHGALGTTAGGSGAELGDGHVGGEPPAGQNPIPTGALVQAGQKHTAPPMAQSAAARRALGACDTGAGGWALGARHLSLRLRRTVSNSSFTQQREGEAGRLRFHVPLWTHSLAHSRLCLAGGHPTTWARRATL